MNFLTQARKAIWAELKGDPAISGALRGGSTFEFDTGVLKRLEVMPVNCPYLAIVPSDADLRPPGTNTHKVWLWRLAIEMATAGQDVEPCEELLVLTLDRLIEPREAYFGLASTGFTGLAIGQAKWVLWQADNKSTANPIWVCNVPVGLKFQRKYPNMGG